MPQQVLRLLRGDQDAAAPDSTVAEPWSPDPISQAFEGGLLDASSWVSFGQTMLAITIILGMAWFLIRVAEKTTHRWALRFEDLPLIHPRRQRAYTIKSLLLSTVRYIVWPVAFITVLSQLEVDVAALVATAGIAGIAIGFGAQSLVKDVISGVLLLFDDSIHVGDVIRIGQDEGIVEYIGVRLIKVRRFNGELLMVPAGELRVFGNRSIDFARVIVNVGMSYSDNHERVMQIMEQAALSWAEEHRDILREENPLVQGITDFADSSVNARVIVKVVPGEQWEAERQLRRAIKTAFDAEGIEIPFPQRTVHVQGGGAPVVD